MAQIIRAILFASATAATILGLRATRAASQRFGLPPFRTTQRITLIAPTISSRRMSVWAILLTAPSLALPPVDLCRGTRPSQAAKFRPLPKVSRSGANAATAPAVTGPIPGMMQSRRNSQSVVDAASNSVASRPITSISRAIYSRYTAPSPGPGQAGRCFRRPARFRVISGSLVPSAPPARTRPDVPGAR